VTNFVSCAGLLGYSHGESYDWLNMRHGWRFLVGGNTSNVATCKSEGNGDKSLLKWMVGKGNSECQPGRGVRIVNRTHFSYAWC
jgi:hypothetical protein